MPLPLTILKSQLRQVFDTYNNSNNKKRLKDALFGDIYAAHEYLDTSAAAYAKAMETLRLAKEIAALRAEIETLPAWEEREKCTSEIWFDFMNRNGDIDEKTFNDPSFNSEHPKHKTAVTIFERHRKEYEAASLRVYQLKEMKKDPRLKDSLLTIELASSRVDSVVNQFFDQIKHVVEKNNNFLAQSLTILRTV